MELIAGLVDVFAIEPLSGNPLAVVEGADGLDDDVMRRVAGEFNQAETTFLMKSAVADWKLRSFTASGAEVTGAGHNALGAWLWLAYQGHLGTLDTPKTFLQEIGEVLPITLSKEGDRFHGRMRQSGLTLSAVATETDLLAHALGLSASTIAVSPPPRTVNTGASHLMVRLKSRADVDRARPLHDVLRSALAGVQSEGCYVYAFDEADPTRAYARFFNPTVGLWEDSATGTAAGPLAAYLGSEGLLDQSKRLIIEQGTLMGRQSFLNVQLTPEPEVSGSGVIVLRGRLTL